MLKEKNGFLGKREAKFVSGLGKYSLKDTLECGQCFRYEKVRDDGEYIEYVILTGDTLIDVAQREKGELIFFDTSEETFKNVTVPFFTLTTDYEVIKEDIVKRTDSEWLKAAAEAGEGIAILKQEPFEALISFIISQNNNIPRIRKMIKKLCIEYGVNISLQNGVKKCPLSADNTPPCEEKCKECGVCYTFPTAKALAQRPEGMLKANPGFRYKYLCDAVEKIDTGAVRLDMIAAARSYEYTKSRLMEICGVGEKVASCVALFGFGNLEAFPIDVWMKRAIDEYFGGSLDYESLGRYRGIAQQYIFHYIRNIEKKEN